MPVELPSVTRVWRRGGIRVLKTHHEHTLFLRLFQTTVETWTRTDEARSKIFWRNSNKRSEVSYKSAVHGVLYLALPVHVGEMTNRCNQGSRYRARSAKRNIFDPHIRSLKIGSHLLSLGEACLILFVFFDSPHHFRTPDVYT
jgi:hypothetical protein